MSLQLFILAKSLKNSKSLEVSDAQNVLLRLTTGGE